MRSVMTSTSLKSKIAGYIFIFFIFITGIEIASYSTIFYLQSRVPFFKFDPTLIKSFDYKTSNNYSTELGWITPYEERDNLGARADKNDFNASCIEMFGDSFTYSSLVTGEYAWPKKLAELINCKVHNFGVGGYGSDQAVLRHEAMESTASIAVLNHLTENIMRNTNQLRNLIYPNNSSVVLKPRFILSEEGALKLIKKPELAESELFDIQLLKQKLQHEYFIPGGDSGIRENFNFPYSFTLFDLALNHFFANSKLKMEPRHSAFYRKEHAADGLKITYKIFQRFIFNSLKKGQLPVITVVPTCHDLEFIRKNKSRPYQPLLDELSENGVFFFDFADSFLFYDDFYKFFGACNSHPNEEGYELMAVSFRRFLADNGVL